jgi:hypothetical protein
MHAQHNGETHLLGDTRLRLPAGMDTAPWGEDARWPGPRQGVGEVRPVRAPVAAATRRRQAACSTS